MRKYHKVLCCIFLCGLCDSNAKCVACTFANCLLFNNFNMESITHQNVQELENPLILIHEKKISDMNLLLRVLELAVKVSILILF